jgi:cytochrome b6-f complex iron-sulfur subunit
VGSLCGGDGRLHGGDGPLHDAQRPVRAAHELQGGWKDRFGVWVVRELGGMYALSTVCTHLGCTPNWLEADQKFKCPCHGSGFYMSGINFEGPAPRPLERYRVYFSEDGQLVVDKSKVFQQEKGQWTDPEAFAKVA